MFYVTMTDKFMSSWGLAEGKTGKFVVKCETRQQAEIIRNNAEKREEMKYINQTIRRIGKNLDSVKIGKVLNLPLIATIINLLLIRKLRK